MTPSQTAILPLAVMLGVMPCFAAPQNGNARVRIHAVDPFGKGLGPVKVRQFVEPRIGGANYSSRFAAGEAENIPFGEYNVSVTAGGIQVGGRVNIYASETFVVLSGSGRFIDYAPGHSPVLTGKVTGLPEEQGTPVWLRVFSLYKDIDGCRTIPVRKDGSFSMGGFEVGQYVVTVVHDGGVLYSGLLRLEDPGSQVQIDVAAGTVNAKSGPR